MPSLIVLTDSAAIFKGKALSFPQLRNIFGDSVRFIHPSFYAISPEDMRLVNIEISNYKDWIIDASEVIDSFQVANLNLKKDNDFQTGENNALRSANSICRDQYENQIIMTKVAKKIGRKTTFIVGGISFTLGSAATGILIAVLKK